VDFGLVLRSGRVQFHADLRRQIGQRPAQRGDDKGVLCIQRHPRGPNRIGNSAEARLSRI
jgi:hypothetical protein